MAGKPNILIIWGDDIGYWNISAYSKGMMGYKTPNIDRIANEGMTFTDCYGEQSCTAGRAAFIMGQSVLRSGLSKVGLPGAEQGMRAEDPTIAELFEAARIRYRSVREEPPRRPGRALAYYARVRRVLRQPLPSERRGGTGTARLSARIGLSQLPEELWPPWGASLLGRWEWRAEDREHRATDQETHGDDRRRICRGRKRFHQARTQGRKAFLRLGQHDSYALSHSCQADERGPVREMAIGISRRHD